ncbi:MAG: hypothetical protein XXXJIFNMEKO3_00831 [Candidatus Erwinia impunctatus]|nr:hypothetical protein XXXJIFNMEKO_00831 [Culicoides impunctatus]
MQMVYLSPVPWESIAQRPHFFVKTALQLGFTSVIWVEPTASRLPKLSDFRMVLNNTEAHSFTKPKGVEIIRTYLLPIESFGQLYDLINFRGLSGISKKIKTLSDSHETILVVGKPSKLALFLLSKNKFKYTVFDIMDDYPFFAQGLSKINISKNLLKIITQVEHCFFTSDNLLKNTGVPPGEKILSSTRAIKISLILAG